MSQVERRPGSLTFLLVGLLLLVTAAGLFIALVPVVRSPKCPAPPAPQDEPVIFFPGSSGGTVFKVHGDSICELCREGIRVTLLARWLGKSWWEGSTVGLRASRGFRRTSFTNLLDRAGLPMGGRISKGILEDAQASLLRTGEFHSVKIEVFHYRESPGTVKISVQVVEK